MEMTGEQLIPLGQNHVWVALNDPGVLKICIPGCEMIEKVADNEYKVAMTAAVGPVRAKFTGKLVLSNIVPPRSYSLAFEGSGGAAGFGKGGADISLSPEGAGTKLSYTARAQVGGKLAQVGSRLIDGVAKKMADDFFVRFKETLVGAQAASAKPSNPASGASTAPSAPSVAAASRSPAGDAASGWLNPLWLVGLVIVAMFVAAIALEG